MRGERAIGLDLGRLTTISLVIAWFNLRLLMDAHCPLRDMVKFRKSAVNAGSRDQLASSYRRHILGRRFLLYLGLRLEMAMTKSVGPRPESCTFVSGINGKEGRDCRQEARVWVRESVVSSLIGVWGGAPEADAILSI